MPSTHRVIVMSEAFSDLEKILDFIAEESPQNAVQMTDRLWKAIQSLADFPHRYPASRRRLKPSNIVRTMPVPPFIVCYRVDDERMVVRVASVRHGKRRHPRI